MIAWVDIETTGLVASEGLILELAIALAEDNAPTEVVDAKSWVVQADIDDFGTEVCQVATQLRANPDQFVIDMHARNGLWEACQTGVHLHQVEAEACKFLRGYLVNKYTMAGASVGSFDLVWIRHHMPDLGELFSHRVLDTTSIKMFAADLGMPQSECPRGESHRAEDDVAESIDHYSRCFRWIQERMK